jgi:hypothetical protein
LENAGLFSIGTPSEVELFFSRRIGIAADGSEVPIAGGGRLSGKIGAMNIGLLNMQTEAVDKVTQASNFTVARLSREFPNRSGIGAMFIDRERTGEVEIANETKYNRTFAVDARLGIGAYTQFSGFAARTATPGRDGRDHGFKLAMNHDSKSWLLQANYTEIAENFNPEVGFLRRFSYRKSETLVLHRYRPKNFLGLQRAAAARFLSRFLGFHRFSRDRHFAYGQSLGMEKWRRDSYGHQYHQGRFEKAIYRFPEAASQSPGNHRAGGHVQPRGAAARDQQ